ncbi:TPA: hypothetical protein ACRRXW_003666, partial [Morganella morganii]
MVNIECYYSDPESGFCTEMVNKQVADLLSVMTKRKEKKQCDNDIPVICSTIQHYYDKCYSGNVLYFIPKKERGDYHFCDKSDAIMTLVSPAGKIKKIIYPNTLPDYILYKNTADKYPGTHPENVISAKEPKSMAAERRTVENIPESANIPEAEYTSGAEYT